MRGQFSRWLGLGGWRDQIRGRLKNPQNHGVVVGNGDIAHTVWARACGDQRKAAPEERMGRIGDLDFGRVV